MKGTVSVSRNYAIAFLNSFENEISSEDFLKIREVRQLWQENKKVFYFLNLPGFDMEKKLGSIQEILKKMTAPDSLKELIFLLIRHGRASLIATVLDKVCSLYKERKNILFFTITSSHDISKEQLSLVQQFLAHKTGKTILYDWSIDKSLIAGMRCESETLVWEHSISRQLDDLRKQFFLQGAT